MLICYKLLVNLTFLVNANKGKIQDTLVELYNHFKQKIEKKKWVNKKIING